MGTLIKNMKIPVKLFLMIGIALIGMLIIGILSIVLMGRISSASTVIAEDWLVGVDESRRMDTKMSDLHLNELRYLTINSESLRSNSVRQINTLKSEISATITEYEKTTEDDVEDQQLLDVVKEHWAAYQEMNSRILQLADQGDVDGALDLLEGEGMEAYNRMSTALNALTVYNSDGSADASQEALRLLQLSIAAMIIIMFLIIVLSATLALFIIRSIRIPVSQVEKAAIEMAKGNLDVKLDYHSRDELGVLSDQVRELVRKLRTIIDDENAFLAKLASGDFTVESVCEEEYIGGFQPLLVSFKGIAARLNDTLGQISMASDQVSAGSDQVASGSQALAQGATEQASSVEQLSSSINEISTQVNSNAENAQMASRLADSVGVEMQQSNQKMQDMIAAMAEISDSSSEIGKIIKAIEDIAFQTNILALNAAVEAARAGTAGKGFAVVADEVRNLASKSAEASKNTASLIERSIQAVDNGTRIADETAKSLIQAVEGAKEVAATVDKISEASSQQSEAISQITVGIDQISSVVQTNSATSEESAAASQELSSQAQVLKSLVSSFQLKGRQEGAYPPAASPQPRMGYEDPAFSSSTNFSKY